MRWSTSLAGLTVLAAVSSTLAQNMPHPPGRDGGGMNQRDGNGPPPPPDGGPDGGPGQDGGPPPPPFDRGGPGGPGGGGPGGNVGPGGNMGLGGPGGQAGPKRSVGAMTSYLELVDRYTKLSNDASAASVSAVISLTEVLRPKGAQVIIDELNKLLPTVKDAAVTRAIRLQLIDFYRAANQPEKAIEQAEILITGSAATTQPTAP